MNDQSKECNAVEYLTEGLRIADDFASSAAAYLERLRELPRCSPAVGQFYQTVDMSVVQVVEIISAGNCPICGRDHRQDSRPSGIVGAFLGAIGVEVVQPEPDHTPCQGQQPAKGFVACIVRGGHGHPKLNGQKPGERYGVDPDGLSVMTSHSVSPDLEILTPYQLRLVGLSLARPISAKFEQVEEAAAAVGKVS